MRERLNGRVPERLSGGVLMILGVLFILLSISVMANGLAGNNPISRHGLGLATPDVIITAAWMIGGVLFWRQQALGYVSGTGLLFQSSMLFTG